MYFIDTSYNSIFKYGEELCGDHVEQVNLDDSKIIVLSDGLGSGVKANILATLTSKIAATMLREGSSLDETIDTIVHTLPICSERELAYSTFTIIQIHKNGKTYIAEFDNPSFFLHKNGKDIIIKKSKRVINDKIIYESSFVLDKDMLLVVVSDGVIHAGVGKFLNLGWEWENVNIYLRDISIEEKKTSSITSKILDVCKTLYDGKAGDDTTVVAVKIREQETINLFTGPPKNPENDYNIIEKILNEDGKVVVCGGTTANIVARTLNCTLEVDLSTITPTIPPVAKIPRIELVTEGVITISKALELLKAYTNPLLNLKVSEKLKEKNAASMLAALLIEECDNLNIWLGQAVNPAHQGGDFPMDFNFKTNQIKELARVLENMGKEVKIFYI